MFSLILKILTSTYLIHLFLKKKNFGLTLHEAEFKGLAQNLVYFYIQF